MMKIGQCGPVNYSDGAEGSLRLGKAGDQIISELHGRYVEQVLRGNVFSFATQSPIALATSHSSTAPTFTLYNPLSSGKNFSLIDVIVAFQAAPAAGCNLALSAQLNPQIVVPASVTTGIIRNALLSSGASSAAAIYIAATLGLAPVTVRHLASIVAASSITPPMIKDEIAGALIVPPGISISVMASSSANAHVSMTWEEIPV